MKSSKFPYIVAYMDLIHTKRLSYPYVLIFTSLSRIIVLFLSILTEILLPDHQATDVATFTRDYPSISPMNSLSDLKSLPLGHHRIGLCYDYLRGFSVWDSAHYLNIAKYGYRNINEYAFLPLFPTCIKYISEYIVKLLYYSNNINSDDALILSGLLLSNICFCVTGMILYAMMQKLRIDPVYIVPAIVCYCISPASIFFSTVYTESSYMMVSWTGMYLLLCPFDSQAEGVMNSKLVKLVCLWMSIGLFFISCCIRSNGILNVLHFLAVFKVESDVDIWMIMSIICGSVAMMLPMMYHNFYIKQQLCFSEDRDAAMTCESDQLINDLCRSSGYNGYNIIQHHYWQVGFMQYYQIKQIPNFMLALPIVIISLSAICKNIISSKVSTSSYDWKVTLGSIDASSIHLLAVLFIGVFIANIQITTRLICSSCPLVIMHMGRLLVDGAPWQRYAIISYLCTYCIIGTILHVNFYPWT